MPDSITSQVLLHIGHYKTGTTWLQESLFVHGNEVFEPVSDTDKGYSTLASHFFADREGYFLSPYSFDPSPVKTAYEKLLADKKRDFQQKIPVVSHERLGGNPSYGGFDAFDIAVRLKAVFPQGKVLISIREQKSMYLSCYYNYLSMGGVLSLKRFLKMPYDRKAPGFSPAFFRYLPLIQHYTTLFGKENVLVLPYEMFARTPELYFEQLSRFVGQEIRLDKALFQVRRNERQDRYINYHMRWMSFFTKYSSINGYSPFYSKPANTFFRGLKYILGRLVPRSLDGRLVAAQKKIIERFIADRYISDNRELSRETGIDLSVYGYHSQADN